MIDPIVHVGAQPARSCTNRSSTACPFGVWTTSGWNCTAQIAALRVLEGGHGRVGRRSRSAMKPSGTSVTASKWLIHTSCSAGMMPSSSVDAPVEAASAVARPYSPRMPAADGAAELLRDQLRAVADAEDRDPELVDRRVEARRAVDVDALRSARQDQRRRAARRRPRAAVIRCGTISEYTFSSRTRRAISCAYCAPKSTTKTGRSVALRRAETSSRSIVGGELRSHAGTMDG